MTQTEPKLIERRYPDSPDGGWETRWMCNPPEMGVGFRVIEQEWSEDFTVRTIYEVETD